jgi:hypothetical protein
MRPLSFFEEPVRDMLATQILLEIKKTGCSVPQPVFL